jgi:hypothetical protein
MVRKIINYFIVGLLFFSAGADLCAQSNQTSTIRYNKIKPVLSRTFKHTDVGNPAIAGTVTVLNEGIDMTAGGTDIWGVKDEFNFVYIERNGDFDFVAQIESLSPTHLYTKAGLMAREDLSAGCRHVYFQVFPDNKPRNKNNGGYEFQYRHDKDGEMKAIYPKTSEGTPEFPVLYPNTWVRLQRIRKEFTGYYSTDGINWKIYANYTLDLPAKIYLGLAVTSHDANKITSAKFRNLGEVLP